MARYILCEEDNQSLKERARSYNEVFEYVAGKAKFEMYCDSCGKAISEGDKCFAAVLLPDMSHPNYDVHHPSTWSHEYLESDS